MTKDEMYSVFDGRDPETALMKLAVSFPGFGLRDLEGVLRELASGEDRYRPGRPPGSRLSVFRSCGMDALRTIFFIMFNTGLWDGEILFQPGFLQFVRGTKAELAARCRAAGYRDRWASDLYEAFAEMEDKLVEKIRSTPEGASCPG